MIKVYIGRQILLVDDDIVFQTAVKVLLEKNSFLVTVASSGEECLQLLKTMSPSLLLLDISMQGLSGMDVLRQIRAMPSHQTLPTVMITGKGETGAISEAAKLGVCDFVLKPFDPKDLIGRVAKHTWFLKADEVRALMGDLMVSDEAMTRQHGRNEHNVITKDCYSLHVHKQTVVLILPAFSDPKALAKETDELLAEKVQVIAKGNPSWRHVFPTGGKLDQKKPSGVLG